MKQTQLERLTVRERLDRIYKDVELLQANDEYRKLSGKQKGMASMIRANVVVLRGEIE